ncbi:MAG TPA: GNAT family N-acetyltransferase [Vitreimonas sp.]|nr:GNAT family N-acetyltransferase [Vitreimonas sp.]
MSNVIFRLARTDEGPALQLLNEEVFIDNHQYDPDLKLDWARSAEGEKYFQELVNDTNSCCIVADDLGKLAGYVAASPREFSYRHSRYLEVDNMGVSPAYRSQGLGGALMQECRTWARKHGYDKLYVNCYAKNEKALAFYKKCGFDIIDMSLEMKV